MTVSIDALRQRRIEVEGAIKPLLDANQVILDAQVTEKRDGTPSEIDTFNKNMALVTGKKASLAMLNTQIDEMSAQMERERASNGGTEVTAHNRTDGTSRGIGKSPYKSLGEQLLAVKRSARTGVIEKGLMFGDFDQDGTFKASGGSDGALNEAVPSEGGFLVGADFSQQIYQRTYLSGEITRRCKRQPISANSNRLVLKVVDEDSRADGQRMGGILAFWANEADTFLSSRPRFREVNLFLNKLTALAFATDEILEDAVALSSWIMENMPDEMNFRVEDALFQGTGAGQPAGILNSAALLSLSPGNTANVITGTDVVAMLARGWLPGLKNTIAAYSGKNLDGSPGPTIPAAAWFISQSTLPQMWNLQQPTGGTAGTTVPATILLYHAPGDNPLYGPYGELMGLPVIPTEHNASLGNQGDIVLADMSQVLLADKGSIQAASSIHVRFLQNEQCFRFTYRVDAQTLWKKPVTPKDGGPTLAPFVALASGANR